LTDQSAPRATDRHANGDLALPCRRPGDEHAGNVRAGDRQHGADQTEQQAEKRGKRVIALDW
jgi:hypothetical protein